MEETTKNKATFCISKHFDFLFQHQHKLRQLKPKVEKLRNIQIKASGKDNKQAVSETSDSPLGRVSLAKLRARCPNAVHGMQCYK